MGLFSKFEFIPPKTVVVHGRDIEVIVKYFKKKSSSVRVKNGTLFFSLSSYLSQKQREEHFKTLLKNISKQRGLFQTITLKDVLSKGYFRFFQEQFEIILLKQATRASYSQQRFTFPDSYSEKTIEQYIIKTLIKLYSSYIRECVETINNKTYGFSYGNITVKSLQSKWGHCTSNNDLLFNLKLLNAPQEVFYYVVCHELAHIKHKNHSPAFWREVEKHCPNYKQLRNYLKVQPPGLYT
jgi:hypothetical protein